MSRPLALLGLLAGVLLLPARDAGAQGFGLSVFAGYDRFQMDREDYLATFTETYNAYYAARIRAPIAPFGQDRGRPVVGATASFGVSRLWVSFFGQVALDPPERRTADLTGLKNHVSVDVNDQMFGGDVALRFGPVAVGGTYAGTFRRSTIRFDTEYADGSRSLGTEYRINGRYVADDAFLEFGPMVALQMGRLSVPVRLLFPAELSQSRSALLDFDVYELNSYFPSDWNRYLNDPGGLDEGNGVANRDFVGPRVQVGLDLRLF